MALPMRCASATPKRKFKYSGRPLRDYRLAGEFFVEYTLQLKNASPLPVFPVTMANGELQGYVVTPEAEAANGYEAQMSLFLASVGEQFVDTTIHLLEQLQTDANT